MIYDAFRLNDSLSAKAQDGTLAQHNSDSSRGKTAVRAARTSASEKWWCEPGCALRLANLCNVPSASCSLLSGELVASSSKATISCTPGL